MSWNLFALSVGLGLAALLVSHLSIYRYSYEPIGTESPYAARNVIVATNHATGEACFWRGRGWKCLDAKNFARVRRQGW